MKTVNNKGQNIKLKRRQEIKRLVGQKASE